VVLLSNGRVQTEGTVPAVLSHPAFIDIFGSEIEALGV
jgi:ABC-type hemin transport system ATPase subunit